MLPLWAVLLAWLCAWLMAVTDRGWRAYAGMIALGIGCTYRGRLITSFGTMVFAPLSDWRAALSTTFIIDLWFSGIIVAGLLACVAVAATRGWPAVAGMLRVVQLRGVSVLQQQRAIDFGEQYARDVGVAQCAA